MTSHPVAAQNNVYCSHNRLSFHTKAAQNSTSDNHRQKLSFRPNDRYHKLKDINSKALHAAVNGDVSHVISEAELSVEMPSPPLTPSAADGQSFMMSHSHFSQNVNDVTSSRRLMQNCDVTEAPPSSVESIDDARRRFFGANTTSV